MKRELGIARCGLACCLCSENVQCRGCKQDGFLDLSWCKDAEWCENRKCCIAKGVDGCWACPDSACRKGLFATKVKALAFTEYVRRYGTEALLDRLEVNEKAGIVYHREGIMGDYDMFDDPEEVIALINTGIVPDGTFRAAAVDAGTAAALACELWPGHSEEEMKVEFERLVSGEDAAVYLYRENGQAVAFAQCQLRRDYVEGTETSPVGYLEGIYVREPERRRGIARELLSACERWAKERGCTEFASDCELKNTESQAFHRAVGFHEANRIVAYVRKI